jgi:hypothetical protein
MPRPWKSQNDFHSRLEISHRPRDSHIPTGDHQSVRSEARRMNRPQVVYFPSGQLVYFPSGERRIKQLLGLDGSTGSLRSRRSRRYSDALIFMAFRGPQAQVNQLRKSSEHPAATPEGRSPSNTQDVWVASAGYSAGTFPHGDAENSARFKLSPRLSLSAHKTTSGANGSQIAGSEK